MATLGTNRKNRPNPEISGEVLNLDPAEKAGLVQPAILIAPAKKRDY